MDDDDNGKNQLIQYHGGNETSHHQPGYDDTNRFPTGGHRAKPRYRDDLALPSGDDWAIPPRPLDPYASHGSTKNHSQINMDDMKNRILFQIEQYPQRLQAYIRPVIRNKHAMKRIMMDFSQLESDGKYVSRSAAQLIQRLQSVSYTHGDTYDSSDNDDNNDDDDWGVTYEINDNDDMEEVWLDDRNDAAEPYFAISDLDDTAPGASGTAFMNWQDFRHYPLSRQPEIINDRRRSILAIVNAVQVENYTMADTFNVEGLFGQLAAVLRRQDWRVYYQTSSRLILLPQEIPIDAPTEVHLESREHRVLNISKYLAATSQPTMTCVTYNDGNYGTITLFDVYMRPGSGTAASTSWPVMIRPYAVLPQVPKELLKNTAKGLPRSKKTELRIKSKEDQLVWFTPGYKIFYVPSSGSLSPSAKAGPSYDPDLKQTELSEKLLEALPMQSTELTGQNAANCVQATIPSMLAWLHARSDHLTHINVQGTRILPRPEEDDTTTAPTTNFATFIKSPTANDHGGLNPVVIVFHPDQGDWVTVPLHWV